MKKGQKPKWQNQVEQILRDRCSDPEFPQFMEHAQRLADLAARVKVPARGAGRAVPMMLKQVSEELYPLAAVYAGFTLGVAWVGYQKELKKGKVTKDD